jgi:hypothetical protein
MNLKKCVWVGILLMLAAEGVGQPINHWETVVYDSMKWRYFPGTADPGNGWNTTSFNDAAWLQGKGGIGYGDGDDRTVISPVLSVFLRKKFTITNRDKINSVLLHVDYDDGFIAYLNGVEIARAFMGSNATVPFNQGSVGLHEALIYQGAPPDAFTLTTQQLELLVAGENTLAIQVHNENISSSDLSSSVFLSVGITDNSTTYLPTPTWFVAPLNFTSSNLPIISINTNGQPIADEPRIIADIGIIDNGVGNRNNLSDPFNNYNNKISIEVRGESSQMFPKKSFRIETQDASGNNFNAALLGMPPENDWVLYAPYTDKTMMRDVLAYKIGKDLGRYTPRTRFVELVINGSYHGVYVLMEKIKVDKNRVDISSLKPADVSGEQLTGGYLLRVDKLDANDYPGWRATPTPQLAGENDITFQYYDPKGEELVPVQRDYIRSYLTTFQSSLTSTNFKDATQGYKKYLDVGATLDFMLVNEIGKNIDGYVFSTYLYKEKDKNGQAGKLVMGPLWDFNLAFGNVDYLANAQFAPGWMWNDQYRMYWFRRMIQDPYFSGALTCRWQELRSTTMTNAYFMNAIDSMANVLSEAQVRNYQRWPILGTYVWPNQFVGQTYAQEIDFIKQWILNRLVWMDANMPGTCTFITGVDESTDVEVFPNPFSEALLIKLPIYNQYHVKIYTSMGRMIYATRFTGTEFQWTGTDEHGNRVSTGLYFVQLYDEKGKLLLIRKVVKH